MTDVCPIEAINEWDGDEAEAHSNAFSDAHRKHYREPQISRAEGYQGPLEKVPEENVRALWAEMFRYFDVVGLLGMPLPPKGLPGGRSGITWHEPAFGLLGLGYSYFRAAALNESRTMHNTWREAQEFFHRHAEVARARLEREILERAVATHDPEPERPKLVYFIGSESGPIKIGMAIDPASRLSSLQTSHHEKLEILATCEGGHERERAYHAQYADSRLHGEWFERTPELLAEIDRLSPPLPSDRLERNG